MRDWLPPVAAGFVAVLIGFASSAVIVFQAAAAAGATSAQVGSWILSLCVGMAVTSIIPSLIYRQPILTAWSTPGAALLAVGLNGVPMSDAIGAFIVCGLMITVCGLTGWFERALMHGGLSYALMTGSRAERLALAVRITDMLLARRASFAQPL